MYKKCRQRLHFLSKLSKFEVSQSVLSTFYQAVVQSTFYQAVVQSTFYQAVVQSTFYQAVVLSTFYQAVVQSTFYQAVVQSTFYQAVVLSTFYQAVVQSVLLYCVMCYHRSLSGENMKKLERVVKQAAKSIHVTPLRSLHCQYMTKKTEKT